MNPQKVNIPKRKNRTFYMNLSKNIVDVVKQGLMIVIVATLFGCGKNDGRNIPDVSGIKVDVKIQRFEQDLALAG